jgi:crotonobetainyl-CoA:carnitine CoA-transferase CaiB-like acyl-CoA transferase
VTHFSPPTPSALAGVRVLELSSGHAAGLAGHFLLGYGAEVVHVVPGGAVPLGPDVISYVHRGKRTRSRADLPGLVASVDLIVSDASPGLLAELGISWTALHRSRPELVIVSVTPFGLEGPYANYEHTNATAFALGGVMGLTGDSDRHPLLTGGSQAYALAGFNAFAAASTGWAGYLRNGYGEFFDLSGQDCSAGMLEYYGAFTSYTGDPVSTLGNHTRATWSVYPCLDGWSGVFALERQVPSLFALLDDPELTDPRFVDPLLRRLPENEDELTAKLYVYFSDKTMAELRNISLKTRVPIGIVVTPNELVDEPGVLARGFFEDSAVGRVPGRPFPGFCWEIPANSTSKDGTSHEPRVPFQSPNLDRAALPLAGIRVLDLTMMWAGPFATMRMAEMGADVIKIESPSAWDNIRTLIPQPGVEDPWNSAFYFNAYNRAKRSLTLDLAQDDGRALFLQLVATADVVIENYRADVLDKLDLSVATLHAANPKLIVVSMAAFGKEGPDADYVGFGPVIEMMTGLASLTGYGDGEPFKTGISYCDPLAGTFAVAAIGLALATRLEIGKGIWIDLAQREAAMTLIGEVFIAAERGEVPTQRGCRDAMVAPQNCYPSLSGEWIVLSIRNDSEWQNLCALIDAEDLASLTTEERHRRHEEIDRRVTSWTETRSADAAFGALQKLGIAAGPVRTTTTILNDPNLLSRGFWQDLPHPKMHSYRQAAPLWRLGQDPDRSPRRHSPLFGEHNDEILRGELGLDDAAVSDLERRNIIATAPMNPGVG